MTVRWGGCWGLPDPLQDRYTALAGPHETLGPPHFTVHVTLLLRFASGIMSDTQLCLAKRELTQANNGMDRQSKLSGPGLCARDICMSPSYKSNTPGPCGALWVLTVMTDSDAPKEEDRVAQAPSVMIFPRAGWYRLLCYDFPSLCLPKEFNIGFHRRVFKQRHGIIWVGQEGENEEEAMLS